MSTIFVFLYSSMIDESSDVPMSLHKTREGAEKTLKKHKRKIKKKRKEEMIQQYNNYIGYCSNHNENPGSFKEFIKIVSFGRWETWNIREMEVLE